MAAVEPYIHTPQKSSTTSNIAQLKKQQQHQQQHQQQQLLQDLTNLKLNLLQSNQNSVANNNNLNVNHMTFPESDETKLARQKLHMKQHSQDLDNEYVGDFAAKKTDPKYQTLPYNTKFGLNKSASSGMIPIPSYSSSLLKKVMQKANSNESDSAKSSESESLNGTKSSSQQQNSHQQLTVHSTPLNTINKSVAVPISNSTPSTSSASAATVTTSVTSHAHKDDRQGLTSKLKSLQIPSGNLVVPPRKPISSVAPTSVTLGPKSTVQSPKVHMVAPSINTAPILSTSESSKSRPALPPKPNKSSDTETAATSASTNTTNSNSKVLKSNSVSSVPTVVNVINKPPISEPTLPISTPTTSPDTNQSSTLLAQNVVDNLPIKAKPLTIKKQPLSEQPRLRTMTSGIKPIQYTSRRIEMPPEFLFPEKANAKTDAKVKPVTVVPTASPPAINTQTVVDGSAQSPGGSSIDETDKSTSSSMSCDDKMTVQNDILRRTRSALSENGKVKLARRVSFDPLALLLDASLEGELELVQKTAMQVI